MASSNRENFDEYKLHAEVRHNPYCVIHSHSDDRLPAALQRPGSEERWERVESLGFGFFGDVWLEKMVSGNTTGPELRATKSVSKLRMGGTRELAALTDFSRQKHRYTRSFVKFLGWFEDESNIYITMEYFPHGTLRHYIKTGIPENEIRKITGQLLIGLIAMHGENYAHRDMKPDNIFIETPGPDWSVKIGDFGISKRAEQSVTALRTSTGTPLYEAPEIRGDVLFEDEDERDGYTNAVDMWSLGCVVYELAAAKQLYPKYPSDYRKMCFGLWYPDKPPRLSEQGWDFIEQLLVLKPDGRMSAEKAINHVWIQHTVASDVVEKSHEMSVSLSDDAPRQDSRDFELTVTPNKGQDSATPPEKTHNAERINAGEHILPHSPPPIFGPEISDDDVSDIHREELLSRHLNPPARKNMMIIVSSEHSFNQGSENLNIRNASVLSALPEHINQETERVFVLIYAPGLKHAPNTDPGQMDEVEGATPYFKTIYTESQGLVEKESMIMPFSTLGGYVHLVRHISPNIVYIQESLTGPNGDKVQLMSGWVRKIVIMVGSDESHDSLIDSDYDESTSTEREKWWMKDQGIGAGDGIDVIDELFIGEDWRSRVGDHA